MSIFSRHAEPPEAGWFQIGDLPEQAAPRRRGSGRVSLSVAQDEPDAATVISERMPALERANAIAESALERVAELRYGALGLCAAALALVLLVVVMIASSRGGGPAAARAAALHRERAQVAQLESELRFSQEQLRAARTALAQAERTAAHTGATDVTNHHRTRAGKR